jgi:hypothetical protein
MTYNLTISGKTVSAKNSNEFKPLLNSMAREYRVVLDGDKVDDVYSLTSDELRRVEVQSVRFDILTMRTEVLETVLVSYQGSARTHSRPESWEMFRVFEKDQRENKREYVITGNAFALLDALKPENFNMTVQTSEAYRGTGLKTVTNKKTGITTITGETTLQVLEGLGRELYKVQSDEILENVPEVAFIESFLSNIDLALA